MNFAAITVELRETSEDRVNAYGLEYRSANAVIPASSGDNEVKLRVLCYNRSGPKLDAVLDWKVGTRALVTGYLMFSDDTAQPLDFVVTTFEPNIPQDMYCNQVVLGNAFFGDDKIKERNNGTLAIKIGTTLDNADVSTWLFMELHESRKRKLNDRVRKGRGICVHGYLREYRKEGDTSPYRAIVANDFTTRKERERSGGSSKAQGSAKGYGAADVDPTPDY